jgi:hypothetical protein
MFFRYFAAVLFIYDMKKTILLERSHMASEAGEWLVYLLCTFLMV